MIIVAFDLGSREAGCVVLEDGAVQRVYEWAWQKPKWTIKKDEELFHRLREFRFWADKCFESLDRKAQLVVAVEEPYVGHPRAALVLGQVLGMLRCVILDHWDSHWSLMPVLVQASEGKLALAGAGNAWKEEMMAAAQMQFPGHEWNEHMADALGVALAAAGKLKMQEIVDAASSQPAPNSGAPQVL